MGFLHCLCPIPLGAMPRIRGFNVAPQIYIVSVRQRPLWLTNGTSPPKLDSGSQKWSWYASWFYPLAQSRKGHWILSCPWLAGPEHTPLQPKYIEETSKHALEVRNPPKHDSYIIHLRKASLCFLHRNSSRSTLSPKPPAFPSKPNSRISAPHQNPNWPLTPKPPLIDTPFSHIHPANIINHWLTISWSLTSPLSSTPSSCITRLLTKSIISDCYQILLLSLILFAGASLTSPSLLGEEEWWIMRPSFFPSVLSSFFPAPWLPHTQLTSSLGSSP